MPQIKNPTALARGIWRGTKGSLLLRSEPPLAQDYYVLIHPRGRAAGYSEALANKAREYYQTEKCKVWVIARIIRRNGGKKVYMDCYKGELV